MVQILSKSLFKLRETGFNCIESILFKCLFNFFTLIVFGHLNIDGYLLYFGLVEWILLTTDGAFNFS